MNWINNDLNRKIRDVFERRYKRKLSEIEVGEIGENLALFLETILSKPKVRISSRLLD